MLSRFQDVGIHSQAHTASGLSPIKSRFLEDGVQTLFFSLYLYALGTRYHHGLDAIGHLSPLYNAGGLSQVFDP